MRPMGTGASGRETSKRERSSGRSRFSLSRGDGFLLVAKPDGWDSLSAALPCSYLRWWQSNQSSDEVVSRLARQRQFPHALDGVVGESDEGLLWHGPLPLWAKGLQD